MTKLDDTFVRIDRARAALGALRFIMIPEMSEELKELAYQQVLSALARLERLEEGGIVQLNPNQTLFNSHSSDQCGADHCPIHKPSNHKMVDWPMQMRTDEFAYGLMERFCEHGVGHPDPDSTEHLNLRGPEGARGTWGTHGCDGCCAA